MWITAPHDPRPAQAWALNYLTESRNESAQVEKTARIYLETNPNRSDVIKQLAAINEQIENAQRAIAKPQSYHFVITPAPAEEKK